MRRRELLKAAAVVLGVGYASKTAAQSKPKMQKETTMAVPSLPNLAHWNAYEAARQALMPNLSRAEPARA